MYLDNLFKYDIKIVVNLVVIIFIKYKVRIWILK